MKMIITTETNRAKAGFPIVFDELEFAVAETAGAGGDFVSLRITRPDDPHHAIELSFAEVAKISNFADELRQGVLNALKAQTKVARAKAVEPEVVEASNGAGDTEPEPEPEQEDAGDEGDEDGQDGQGDAEVASRAAEVAQEGTKRRRATRRPRGTAGPAAG